MAKKKTDPGVDELIRIIDGAVAKAMQDQADLVLSGKLPERRNLMATGAFHGLASARDIIIKTYKAFLKEEDRDED
jgi:hypothetical protein